MSAYSCLSALFMSTSKLRAASASTCYHFPFTSLPPSSLAVALSGVMLCGQLHVNLQCRSGYESINVQDTYDQPGPLLWNWDYTSNALVSHRPLCDLALNQYKLVQAGTCTFMNQLSRSLASV